MVLDGTDVTPGTIIEMNDIVQMYVYIPRYKYKVFSSNAPITIDVVFEPKTSITGRDILLTSDPSLVAGQYITHSAFYYEEVDGTTVELDGIWVGKFEQAEDNKIVPNVNSMHSKNISELYTNIRSMNHQNGFDITTDLHMLKNSEWAAAVYLSQSNYGICKTTPGESCGFKIENNNYYNSNTNDIVTGCGGDDTKQSTTTAGIEICPVENRWNTPNGVSASTTHNITGIYDMAGGRYEYMMAVGNQSLDSSGFTALPEEKYYDSYEVVFDEFPYHYEKGLLGDGTEELESGTVAAYKTWNDDYAGFPRMYYAWFSRGSRSSHGASAGAFCFGDHEGESDSRASARSSLWVAQ